MFKNFFINLWHIFAPTAEKALSAFEAKLTPDVIKLATDAIKSVPAALSGVEARDAAKATLVADLHTIGVDAKDFAENELNLLIELVYLPTKG